MIYAKFEDYRALLLAFGISMLPMFIYAWIVGGHWLAFKFTLMMTFVWVVLLSGTWVMFTITRTVYGRDD